MKKILLCLMFAPIMTWSQQTLTSIADGNFYNPLTWDCICLPANGDQVIINHNVTLDYDLYYTAGQIQINPGGSLIEAGVKNVWIDGGSLVNSGTYSTHLLYVSNGGFITNTGNMYGIDSMLVQADVTNSGTAAFNDFWIGIGGSMVNTGTMTNTDSLLCQGSFTNSGSAGVYDLAVDQMGTLANSGNLLITNNMNNQGLLTNDEFIDITNDFSNWNTQSQDAMLVNNGIICVGNDFYNNTGDTLTGSGDFYVGNLASNLGVITGTLNFYTPSGTFAIQLGTVDSGVNVAAKLCAWSVGEIDGEHINMYPNPTTGIVNLSVSDVNYSLYSLTGEQILKGMVEEFVIDLSNLNEGVYLLKLPNSEVKRIVKL